MQQKPLVTLITVNYNQAAVTAALLRSLACLHYPNIEVVVVDNASAEPSAWLKDAFPFITYVVAPDNMGFAGGNNLGLAHAHGEYVFFVNNDTEVTPDLLDVLTDYLHANPKCGMASPKIKFFQQPDIVQYAGCSDMHPVTSRTYATGSMEKDEGQFDCAGRTGTPHGAAMMVPATVIRAVGPMAEDYFLYYEELDWSARIKTAGYEVHYVGTATIYHKESVSTGRNSPFKTYYLYRNRLLYIRRNYQFFSRLIAVVFFIGVSVPVHAVKHLLKGESRHAVAIVKALGWHFQFPVSTGRKKRHESERQKVRNNRSFYSTP